MKNMQLAGGILVVLLLVGGGFFLLRPQTPTTSTSQTAQSSSKTEEKPNSVAIKGYAFSPNPLKVKKGTTVTWTNMDVAQHTITADNASSPGPKSELFGQGKDYSFTFTTVGTYPYHCEPHPYMKAVIEVTE